jgi:hypothetical protein
MTQSWIELFLLGQERVTDAIRRTTAPRSRAGATLVLREREVVRLRLTGWALRVACVAGRLWATVDGSTEDHLLLPGEARRFRGRGTVVVQALRPATARLDFA